MKKSFILFLVFVSVYSYASDLSFFDEADSFFKTYIENGGVNYKAIKQHPEQLNKLVQYIEDADINQMESRTAKAFYLNAYNLLVIHSVIKNYPIKSPMDVSGFFDKAKHTVGGKETTLNDLENKIIRPNYKDSRIHFALVCAAKGCPKIPSFSFKPENVDSQLLELTQEAMNSPLFTRVSKNEKTIRVSEIFKWYKEDFLNEAKTIIDYVNQYRDNKIDNSYKVEHYTYDWQLNTTK